MPGSGHQNETGRKGPGDSGARAASEGRSRVGHGFGKPAGWVALGGHLAPLSHCHMGRLMCKKAEN